MEYFNAKYNNCDNDYKNQGIDQLQEIITQLKDKSREILED